MICIHILVTVLYDWNGPVECLIYRWNSQEICRLLAIQINFDFGIQFLMQIMSALLLLLDKVKLCNLNIEEGRTLTVAMESWRSMILVALGTGQGSWHYRSAYWETRWRLTILCKKALLIGRCVCDKRRTAMKECEMWWYDTAQVLL